MALYIALISWVLFIFFLFAMCKVIFQIKGISIALRGIELSLNRRND